MYNELWLSKFVVIKEDKREISSVAKGVWILNGLWESHPGDLNLEKTTASLIICLHPFLLSIQRSHHVSYLSPFSSTFFITTPVFTYCSFVERNPTLKTFFCVWKLKLHENIGETLGYDIPIFFPYVLASQTLR